MFFPSAFRSRRRRWILVFAVTCALGVFASPDKNPPHNNAVRVNRHDPAFRAGYMEGYRQGAGDSEALSNSYRDESGPAYAEATDGYTTQYGDKEVYQQRFRLGYIAGYKAGWDFNAGLYNPLGAGSW
ncbi:MAG: hypothetical protein WA188_09755 [Terriglobales bacterium]